MIDLGKKTVKEPVYVSLSHWVFNLILFIYLFIEVHQFHLCPALKRMYLLNPIKSFFFLLSLRWWTWLRPSSVLRVTPTPMERRLHWSGGCWAAEVPETSCVWALTAHMKINKLWFMSVLFVVVVCLQPRPLSPSWPGGVHLRCDIPAF